MIDWTIARTIGNLIAGSENKPNLQFDLQAMVNDSKEHLDAYTLLSPSHIPSVELLSRHEWIDMNLTTAENLMKPLTEKLDSKQEEQIKNKYGQSPAAEMFFKAASSLAASAQVGGIFGYMSQRVLGQVEAAILFPEESLRLVFVPENMDQAIQKLAVDQESFIKWIVLHELTHVYQMAGVPWLKSYLKSLMEEYIKAAKITEQKDTDEKPSLIPTVPDIEQIKKVLKDGNIISLFQTEEQMEALNKLQGTMALIEGHAEHVMDAVGEQVLPHYEGLRESLQSRREEQTSLSKLLQKLLGLDIKMRQYKEGKIFCDYIVEKYGIKTLNKAWEDPSFLPVEKEIQEPEAWVSRVFEVLPEVVEQPVKAKHVEKEVIAEPQADQEVGQSSSAKDINLNSKGKEILEEIDDEAYLRALLRDHLPEQTKKDMKDWLIKASSKGWVEFDDGEQEWIVSQLGKKRLAEILSKDV